MEEEKCKRGEFKRDQEKLKIKWRKERDQEIVKGGDRKGGKEAQNGRDKKELEKGSERVACTVLWTVY
jgi:hypothetical protein